MKNLMIALFCGAVSLSATAGGNAAIGKINSVLHGLEADIKAGASTITDPQFHREDIAFLGSALAPAGARGGGRR